MTSLELEALRQRRRRRTDVLLILAVILLFVLGAGVMLYPDIASWLASRSHAGLIEQYQHAIEDMEDEEIMAQFERARKYNDALLGGRVEDPFVAGSGFVIPSDYYEILSVQETMGIIDIPAIDVHIPIFHGVSDAALMRGVGHIPDTPFPVGQMGKHAVLTGHTGIPSSRLFTDLELLEIGDIFILSILNERMAYQIDQKNVVLPHEIGDLRNLPDQDLVTLVTCTPYAINSHRLLVRGHRVPYEEEMEEDVHVIVNSLNWRVLLVVGVLLMFLIGWIMFAVKNRRKRPQDLEKREVSSKIIRE